MNEQHSGNDITVVIPAHNCAPFIEQTLDSIERQTVHPATVIIVENASTDDSLSRIEAFSRVSTLNIQCIHTDYPGVSNARNIGFSFAATSLIAMLDADDIYTERFLEQALTAFNAIPSLAVFFGNRKPLQDGEIVDTPFLEQTVLTRMVFDEVKPGLRHAKEDLFPALLNGSFISCSGAVVSRECAHKAGLFPVFLTSSEDRHFFCRLALTGEAAYTLGVTHYYRTHGHSKTGSSAWLEIKKNAALCLQSLRLELVNKHLSKDLDTAFSDAIGYSRQSLYYAAAEAGIETYRDTLRWANSIGLGNDRRLFFLLKAVRNTRLMKS